MTVPLASGGLRAGAIGSSGANALMPSSGCTVSATSLVLLARYPQRHACTELGTCLPQLGHVHVYPMAEKGNDIFLSYRMLTMHPMPDCAWRFTDLRTSVQPPAAPCRTPHPAAPCRTQPRARPGHVDRFGDNGFTRWRKACARFGTSDPPNTAAPRLALPLKPPGPWEKPMSRRLISAIAILFVMLSPLVALA